MKNNIIIIYIFVKNTEKYQCAAKGRQRSRWNGIWRKSRNRTAASMYRNSSHSITVGRHTPLSVQYQDLITFISIKSYFCQYIIWIVPIWETIFRNIYICIYICITQYICLLHTSVPNILHPNISAGSKKQPVYRDEEKANHVWCKCNTNKKHREGLENKRTH